MRTLLSVFAIVVAAVAAQAQNCPVPNICANVPAACCQQVGADTFLAEECTSPTSSTIHFVLPGTGTGWIDRRLPALFSVAGETGTVTLGNTASVTFQFIIGTSDDGARFQVFDGASQTTVGQCVTTRGNTYPGLPNGLGLTIVETSQTPPVMRSLHVSGRNPLWCRYTQPGQAETNLLCFQVKGQVGGPFESGQLCTPDRVEYACGVVQ